MDPSKKDEFLDAVYWTRQVVALLLGLVWGVVGLTGFVGIASFVAVNSAFVYLYASAFKLFFEFIANLINHSSIIQGKFNKDHDSVSDGIKEGFMSAFSVFMVCFAISHTHTISFFSPSSQVSWIIAYSASYY